MPGKRFDRGVAITLATILGAAAPASAMTILSPDELNGARITVNPAQFGRVGDIVTPGLTITDGYNRVGRTYAPDRTYLDLFGPVILKFTAPVSGFVFDFISKPERPNFRLDIFALDAADQILEQDSFSQFATPAPYFLPSGSFGISNVGAISRVVISNSFGNNSMYVGKITYSVASVPEPSSWIAMVVGFGFIGANIRRAKGREASVTHQVLEASQV